MSAQGVPRLGILAFHVIQYQVPLYQRLTARGVVDLDVLFLRDTGVRPAFDPGFGHDVAWDIDLLSGYRHAFLTQDDAGTQRRGQIRALWRWIRGHDVVVIHGYSDPWMLTAVAMCRLASVPYLLRGDSKPDAQGSQGLRRWARDCVARAVVSRSAGALTIGQLNTQFYRRFGQPGYFWAPYSVDDERFASSHPRTGEVRRGTGLPGDLPVIVMAAKMIPLKRHLDVVKAVARLPEPAALLLVGDGPSRGEVEAEAEAAGIIYRIVGFINQHDLPAYYQAADVLVLASDVEQWGLVVNEGMAAGLLPVVSDRVGAAPDLVSGVGYIYPVGDVDALSRALAHAIVDARNPEKRRAIRERAARYSLDRTAEGFEQAATGVAQLRKE